MVANFNNTKLETFANIKLSKLKFHHLDYSVYFVNIKIQFLWK